MSLAYDITPEEIVREVELFIDAAVERAGGDTSPVAPSHRVPFHWPPHPVSADYHVLASDWTGRERVEVDGESYDVLTARTPHGVFGRLERVWNEAMGDSVEAMLAALVAGAEPFFRRQRMIAETLGRASRFEGTIRDLNEIDVVKLLYCQDRDVANDARIEIEKHASTGLFTDALILILRDTRHPHRRIAQWCVLDMFEDLPTFCRSKAQETDAIQAIRQLIWSSEDDYARTIYKAGVVLGGHICTHEAADALIACLQAPSRVGRRSAIHSLFHLAEWLPSRRGEIVTKLRNRAMQEPEPLLKVFAESMVRDIESGATEHMTEPVFPGE